MGALNPQDIAKDHKAVLLPVFGLVIVVALIARVLDSGGGYWNIGGNTPDDPEDEITRVFDRYPEMILEDGVDYSAIIKTNKGDIEVDLYEGLSPLAVNNFVFLAKQNYYDNLTFHRVVSGLLIQGGDPSGNGTGGPGYTFADEVDNGLVFGPGLLAMANTGAPVSNGSQFFITTSESQMDHLNGKHTIFGTVVKGLSFVDNISELPVFQNSQPKDVVRINDVEIVEVR